MKITVLNTGGTFNKRYNPITGQLEVPSDNIALDKIIKSCFNVEFDIKNIVSKDSLDFTQEDRKTILENIINNQEKLDSMKKNTSLLANKYSTHDICSILLKK